MKCIASPSSTPDCLPSLVGPNWNQRQKSEWRVVGNIKPTCFQASAARELRLAIHLGEGYSDYKPTALWIDLSWLKASDDVNSDVLGRLGDQYTGLGVQTLAPEKHFSGFLFSVVLQQKIRCSSDQWFHNGSNYFDMS